MSHSFCTAIILALLLLSGVLFGIVVLLIAWITLLHNPRLTVFAIYRDKYPQHQHPYSCGGDTEVEKGMIEWKPPALEVGVEGKRKRWVPQSLAVSTAGNYSATSARRDYRVPPGTVRRVVEKIENNYN
ncbi:hypothetical protein EDC01DRAFT_789735 [Geopyxis carbonaria]|nr:hypothetical protein EDC01DRAFT_789735 [Geopyxis carbonaria]